MLLLVVAGTGDVITCGRSDQRSGSVCRRQWLQVMRVVAGCCRYGDGLRH